MNFQIKTQLTLLTISLLALSNAYAQTPNSGSISQAVQADVSTQSTDNTPIAVSSVSLQGNTLLTDDKLQPTLNRLNGQSTTFAGLQRLADDISDVYHKAGYPLVSVIIPPQKIDEGKIVLQVIEGKIGTISLNNQSRVRDDVINRYVDNALTSHQVLEQKQSEQAIAFIKELAGVDNVSYQMTQGQQPNTTDLVINTTAQNALQGTISLDNHGSQSTGVGRVRASVQLNSPMGYGERITLDGMTSFKGVNHAHLGLSLPIGTQGNKLSANVSRTQYDLGGQFKDLKATGYANTLDLAISRLLINQADHSLAIEGGVQYSRLQDTIATTNTTTHKTNQAAQLTLSGQLQDNIGAGAYTNYTLGNTIGKLGIDSLDARAIDDNSAKTHGVYYKLTGSIVRTQFLNPQWSLNTSIHGQWANRNLDSSQQLSLGGAYGVSAYHGNDVSADKGLIAQAELRYRLHPNLMLSGFYEYGTASLRHTPFMAGNNHISIQGAGVGLYANHQSLSLESKLAMRTTDQRFSNDKSPRLWLKAGWRF